MIQTLSAALNKALTTPAVTQTLADMGATPLGGTPAQFGSFIQAETRELSDVIRAADMPARTDIGERRPSAATARTSVRKVMAPAAC